MVGEQQQQKTTLYRRELTFNLGFFCMPFLQIFLQGKFIVYCQIRIFCLKRTKGKCQISIFWLRKSCNLSMCNTVLLPYKHLKQINTAFNRNGVDSLDTENHSATPYKFTVNRALYQVCDFPRPLSDTLLRPEAIANKQKFASKSILLTPTV